MAKIIIIASGKGGAGKTSLCAGICTCMANQGKKVLAIDADIGFRNLDIVFGMTDRLVFSFKDVALGICSLEKGVSTHPKISTLDVLTAPQEEGNLFEIGIEKLKNQWTNYDYVFIDLPAGRGEIIKMFTQHADEAIVIATPESVAMRGAEAIARHIEKNGLDNIRLVVNRIRLKFIKFQKAENIDDIMDAVGVPLLGIVPEDEDVISCSNLGKNIIMAKDTGASKAYCNIAKRIDGKRISLMKL